MSKRKPEVFVYANPENPDRGISYCGRRNNVVTAGSLNIFDTRKNPIQTRITVNSLQNHLDEGYDLFFDINPVTRSPSPINPAIKKYLESKLLYRRI
ncbi:hypothetical protein J4402_02385 [Candidatus Pacearchaeota archaeon]|nr:hypothetical protein [uncultured archaeon]AQS31908.1 hypothetical protein [uncultured archaeon]MBS3088606.1 hypothetical protein [Candidatus Pacearchaeota archaeon]